MSKNLAFVQCIMDYELLDVGYTGSSFTQCNGWSPDKRVCQRLDRVLINHDQLNIFESTNINHLIRTGSDHFPLLISAKPNNRDHMKYFRFIDFWTEEHGLMSVVEQSWNVETSVSLLWKFYLKLKNTYGL